MSDRDFERLEYELREEARELRRENMIDFLKNARNAAFLALAFAIFTLIALFYDDSEAFAAGVKDQVDGGSKQELLWEQSWEQVVPEFTEGEAMELMRVARAEASGEGPEGQALVICVIINRYRDENGSFGSTIHEVITQPNQFSTVSSGAWLQEPNADSFEALEMVRNGWDESQGALYFRATWSGHFSWANYLFTYGGHNFYS